MREIKFRAWDKEKKEMCIVTRLEFAIGGDVTRGQFGWYGRGWEEVEGTLLKNRRYVLMQYKGLKDKNGKEIYEGDIVQQCRVWDGITVRGEVMFRRGMFVVRHGEQDYLLDEGTAEVIGNIYENPELLKERREE